MEKTIKIISKVLTAVIIVEFLVIFYSIGSMFHWFHMQTVDAKPDIRQTAELKEYVADVNLEIPETNGSLDGVSCDWRFFRGNLDVGDCAVVDGTVYDYYTMVAHLKNETNSDISGLRLFCSLPTEVEQDSVVCDTAMFCSWLEYNNSTIASTGLELSGGDVPIRASFVSGSAGYVRKNDTKAVLLSAYDNASEDKVVYLADYWRNEGLELDIPAGEEWAVLVYFAVEPIYNLEVATTMTVAGTNQTGSSFAEATFLKDYWRQFHVRTEIVCHDNTPLPIELRVHFTGKADLLPNTIKVDGELIDDLVPQGYDKEYNDTTNFRPIQLKDSAKAGDVITVEYDVEIWATNINAQATHIMNSVSCEFVPSHATTYVTADIKRFALW